MAFELKPAEKHYIEVNFQVPAGTPKAHGVKEEFELEDGTETVETVWYVTSRVPLADSLPMPWLVRFNELRRDEDDEFAKASFFYDLFRAYCGATVDALTIGELGQLISAWNDATMEDTGANPGE